MEFFSTILANFPLLSGGVDPDRAKRVSGAGAVEIPRFAQDDRDPDCRQSTTLARFASLIGRGTHPYKG